MLANIESRKGKLILYEHCFYVYHVSRQRQDHLKCANSADFCTSVSAAPIVGAVDRTLVKSNLTTSEKAG